MRFYFFKWYSNEIKFSKLRLKLFHTGNLIHFWPELRKSCWTSMRLYWSKKNFSLLHSINGDRESHYFPCLSCITKGNYPSFIWYPSLIWFLVRSYSWSVSLNTSVESIALQFYYIVSSVFKATQCFDRIVAIDATLWPIKKLDKLTSHDVRLCPGVQQHPHGCGHQCVLQVGLEGHKLLRMLD